MNKSQHDSLVFSPRKSREHFSLIDESFRPNENYATYSPRYLNVAIDYETIYCLRNTCISVWSMSALWKAAILFNDISSTLERFQREQPPRYTKKIQLPSWKYNESFPNRCVREKCPRETSPSTLPSRLQSPLYLIRSVLDLLFVQLSVCFYI